MLDGWSWSCLDPLELVMQVVSFHLYTGGPIPSPGLGSRPICIPEGPGVHQGATHRLPVGLCLCHQETHHLYTGGPVPSPGLGSRPIYIPAGPGVGVTTILLHEPLPDTGADTSDAYGCHQPLLQAEVVVVVAEVHSKVHPVPPPLCRGGTYILTHQDPPFTNSVDSPSL